MTKNKNKKSLEAAKQEAFKLSDGICYCKTPEFMSSSDWDCPYFQMDNEYAIVKKQM